MLEIETLDDIREFVLDRETDVEIRRWTVRREYPGVDPIVIIHEPSGTVRVEHHCNGGGRWPDGVIHVVAPALQTETGAHTFCVDPMGPTVTPSILCGDCQLHGFVTNGMWRDA